jgi:hypothetical protein
MPNWHIKRNLRRTPIPPLYLHRIGHGHAFRRPYQQTRVEVNVAIMRILVRLRRLLATHELARRLDQLEWRQSERDGRVQYVFETIPQLISSREPEPVPIEPKQSIGLPTSDLVRSAG